MVFRLLAKVISISRYMTGQNNPTYRMSNVHADMRNTLFLLSFFVVSRGLLRYWASIRSEQYFLLFHRTVQPCPNLHALRRCNLEILSGIDHLQYQRSS